MPKPYTLNQVGTSCHARPERNNPELDENVYGLGFRSYPPLLPRPRAFSPKSKLFSEPGGVRSHISYVARDRNPPSKLRPGSPKPYKFAKWLHRPSGKAWVRRDS